jgi:hypothetical protein
MKSADVGRRFLVLVLSAIAFQACNGATPAAPDRAAATVAASPASAAMVTSSPRGTAQLALQDGQFSFTTPGGVVSGTYTGVASVSNQGRTSATLDLQVTGGTDSYAGATGTLAGDGTGGFVGEGSFTLSVRGSLATSSAAGLKVKAAVAGTSALACSNGLILMTLTGDGITQKAGDTHATLSHVVGTNAGCGQ